MTLHHFSQHDVRAESDSTQWAVYAHPRSYLSKNLKLNFRRFEQNEFEDLIFEDFTRPRMLHTLFKYADFTQACILNRSKQVPRIVPA